MSNTLANSADDETLTEINLKDPRLAAFLAWLVPGLGHIYQGRTGKGVLFFVCILGTFFYGLYIGSGRVVYASTEPIPSRPFLTERWQYVCQLGVGLPALPALVQRYRMANNEAPLFGDGLDNKFMRPPYQQSNRPEGVTGFRSEDPTDPENIIEHPDELAMWNYELGEYFEIGTVFTVIAGLLNILAIFDAYGGPLVIPPSEEKKKSDEPASKVTEGE
jgi:hypothetical protein